MKANFHTFSILAALILVAVLFVSEAGATNGYFSHGYGVPSKGMAGVATAYPRDALAAASNPAGMFFVGSRYDFNISIFSPNRQYTVTGNPSMQPNTFPLTPGKIESDSKVFFIPALAANWMLCSKTSLGLSIYGNGGMNTDYNTKTFDSPFTTVSSPTGVDLMQLFVAPTLAREIAPRHSIGVTGIFAYQRFEAKGLQAFGGFSADPMALSDNDYATSTGFGARFGYLGEVTNGLWLGASYQTKVFMGEFDEYAGLFAEDGDFDIPSNWSVGVAVQATRTLLLAADVQQIRYSEINSVGNPMNPQNFQQGILLGDDNGSGFGWEDMTTFKFGLEWEGIVDMPIRLGYSYGEQPIPESEMMFNILAPGVIQNHLTFGFSRKMCGGKELSFAVMRAFCTSISGPNPMEVPGQQTIELEMNQWEFSVGFSF
jgi:long-chain fatty acid transport protein